MEQPITGLWIDPPSPMEQLSVGGRTPMEQKAIPPLWNNALPPLWNNSAFLQVPTGSLSVLNIDYHGSDAVGALPYLWNKKLSRPYGTTLR